MCPHFEEHGLQLQKAVSTLIEASFCLSDGEEEAGFLGLLDLSSLKDCGHECREEAVCSQAHALDLPGDGHDLGGCHAAGDRLEQQQHRGGRHHARDGLHGLGCQVLLEGVGAELQQVYALAQVAP